MAVVRAMSSVAIPETLGLASCVVKFVDRGLLKLRSRETSTSYSVSGVRPDNVNSAASVAVVSGWIAIQTPRGHLSVAQVDRHGGPIRVEDAHIWRLLKSARRPAMFTDPMLGGAAVLKVADSTPVVNALSRDTCTSYSEFGARPYQREGCCLSDHGLRRRHNPGELVLRIRCRNVSRPHFHRVPARRWSP